MPTYEYYCEECGAHFELTKKVSEFSHRGDCPSCNSKNSGKLLISVGFTHGDCPSWLNGDVRNAIQGDNEKPLETRKEYNAYLKEKNIVKI